MLFLALALIAGVVGFVFYSLLSDAEEKAVVRSSLRQLEGYEVQDVRDQELLIPIYQRALLPVLKGLTSIGGRFTPVGYVDTVRKKFVYAGRISADGVDRFLAIRVITVVLIPFWFIFVTAFLPVGLGAAMFVINPEYIGVLFSESIGHFMIGGALTLAGFGFWWMKKIIEIDV